MSRQALIESHFPTVICAPIFSSGQGSSTQIFIGIAQGMKHDSWIFFDNLVSLRKTELTQFVASLSTAKIADLDRALQTALALYSTMSSEHRLVRWEFR